MTMQEFDISPMPFCVHDTHKYSIRYSNFCDVALHIYLQLYVHEVVASGTHMYLLSLSTTFQTYFRNSKFMEYMT